MINHSKNFVILALGGNLGDRYKNLKSTIKLINSKNFKIKKTSNFYESKALLKDGSKPEWNLPFLNCAISGYTDLKPNDLLDYTQNIERIINTNREKGNWSPREVDVDIIFYNNEIIDQHDLKIPHLEIENRLFVLYPIKDLDSNWKNPRLENYSLNNHIEKLEKKTPKNERPQIINKLNYND